MSLAILLGRRFGRASFTEWCRPASQEKLASGSAVREKRRATLCNGV
jgi:hypothetical protein